MRPATRLFTAFSILMLACIGLLGWVHMKNLRKTWPKEQVKRCSTLCGRLRLHHEQHGSYPSSLHDLVDGKALTEKEYDALKFQPAPWSGRLEWQYHAPQSVHEIVLFSGKPGVARGGGGASYFLGFADGATLIVAEEHLAWHLKRTGTEWIGP